MIQIRYNKKMKNNINMKSCACCGELCIDDDETFAMLLSSLSILILSSQELDDYNSYDYYKIAFSIYYSDTLKEYYHIILEFVQINQSNIEEVNICVKRNISKFYRS